ncbi:hypothetical protein ES319_A07G078400v1 [Gossypium barbadense]|uniref:Uncharacterized protein n=2 Tax=Gossypium TaxID=3633 RepID=A0A5J5V123_GOSBA|nr:hypothetical protein ES319_A07G078400v1 [Gossypium barbadense]TYH09277.1 hypothetical protein ES288_A07G082200v1 [Gossypium darwinii]
MFFAERLMPQAFNRRLATSEARPSGSASTMLFAGREDVEGCTDVGRATRGLGSCLACRRGTNGDCGAKG